MGKAKATQEAPLRQADWLLPTAGPDVAAGGPGAGQRPAGVGGSAPANLDLLQTTVRPPKNPWLGELSVAIAPLRKVRAAALYAVGGQWHAVRARSLGRTIQARLDDCGKRKLQLLNSVTGEIIDRPVRCLQATCTHCCKYRALQLKRKMAKALPAITAAETADHRRPIMITATVRHCGNPHLDRVRLQRAWQGIRATWAARYRLDKRPGFSFLRIPELAEGGHRDGHAHTHTLAWMPEFFDYAWLQRAWRKALRTADENLGVVWPSVYLRDNAGNLKFDVVKNVKRVVHYIAKIVNYITKVGTALESLQPEVAATYIDGSYGRRWFATSRGLMRVTDTSFDVWELHQLPEPVENPPAFWWRWRAPAQAPPLTN